jgi:photosystem II stability/assembly factor-like uncharacterized protein
MANLRRVAWTALWLLVGCGFHRVRAGGSDGGARDLGLPSDLALSGDLAIARDLESSKSDFARPLATFSLEPMSGSARSLFAVLGTSGSDVYVVGEGGLITHSTGDGKWSANQAPATVTDNLYAISLSASRILVAGDNGLLLENVGMGWLRTDTMSTLRLLTVWQQSNEILLAGVRGTYVDLSLTGDTVNQWPTENNAFGGIWGLPEDLYIVGDAMVLHRINDGPWNATMVGNAPTFWAVWGPGRDDIYAVGESLPGPVGTIYHATGLDDWTKQSIASGPQLTSVFGSSAQDIWAVGFAGTVLHSFGGGSEWVKVDVPTSVDLFGVWLDAHDIFIVGDQSTIVHGRR